MAEEPDARDEIEQRRAAQSRQADPGAKNRGWLIATVVIIGFIVLLRLTGNADEPSSSPMDDCVRQVRRIAQETGQPAGSESEIRRACAARGVDGP